MDTNEILANEEVLVEVGEAMLSDSDFGFGFGCGVGLGVLGAIGGLLAYKYLIKPAVAKIKDSKIG
jgi:hypothetical protein